MKGQNRSRSRPSLKKYLSVTLMFSCVLLQNHPLTGINIEGVYGKHDPHFACFARDAAHKGAALGLVGTSLWMKFELSKRHFGKVINNDRTLLVSCILEINTMCQSIFRGLPDIHSLSRSRSRSSCASCGSPIWKRHAAWWSHPPPQCSEETL